MRLDQTAEGVFLELQRWTRRQLCSQWARVIMCWEFEGLFQISSQLLHLSALQTTRPLGLHATSRPFTIEGTRNCELGNCTSCIHTHTHTHTQVHTHTNTHTRTHTVWSHYSNAEWQVERTTSGWSLKTKGTE